jgi:Phenylalanyl-tRNA synthetase beta subunit
MKLIIKDILERTGHINDVDDLSDKLIQLGHEHEIDKDIIDLELTPNRGDCFSLKGILRDLNSLSETNSDFEIFNEELDRLDFKFKNNLKDACPVITFLEIEIESIPDIYHDYMDNYFDKLNQKKNNFFTDVSKYTFLCNKTAHPLCMTEVKINNSMELDIIHDSS